MIEIDGRQYLVKQPEENTADMLERINTYCTENDVKNSKGEVIQIEARMSSPIYLILWALGYLITVFQNMIVSLANMLSVQSSSEQQLLNLADLAAIKRGKPSKTTFTVVLNAMARDDPDYNEELPCIVTSSDTMTYKGITYAPALHPQIELQPGDTKFITMVAQTEGAQQISEGTILEFDSPIINLKSLIQKASIPGQAEESIPDLRARMQRRQYSGTSIDAAIDAIRALEGITAANVIYNPSDAANMYVGDIAIQPRHCLIIVQGYNQNIARAYFEHLSAAAVPLNDQGEIDLSLIPEDRILELQTYLTHAQQELPVLVLKPRLKPIYIRIYISMPIVGTIEAAMQQAVAETIGQSLVIGQEVTAAMILSALTSFNPYGILGATMCETENGTYSYKVTTAEDVVWELNTSNIHIVMPGVLN